MANNTASREMDLNIMTKYTIRTLAGRTHPSSRGSRCLKQNQGCRALLKAVQIRIDSSAWNRNRTSVFLRQAQGTCALVELQANILNKE
jgi:hypothetical protein